MLIYKIKLPKKHDADAFVHFMNNEYFPAVALAPTRLGGVDVMVLYQGDTTDKTHDFFWHLGDSLISGFHPRVNDEKVNKKFLAFEAHLEEVGMYVEVAAWHRKTAG